MAKKTKRASDSSWSNIDLGVQRKGRINGFRAKREEKGAKIKSIEEAVNILVDLGLEHETLNG